MGFIIAAFVLLLIPVALNGLAIAVMVITFLVLNYTKISTPFIVLAGILLGYFL
ncbi:hypothetical protein D3C86_1853360 [compost metagenome]